MTHTDGLFVVDPRGNEPSYPGCHAGTWLGHFVRLPTTIFLNAAGKVVATHAGRYRSAPALARDIARYAG